MGLEIINELKKAKGLTNAQLAEISGVTLSTLDKITAGINKNPKLGTLQAICRALGCKLDDLDDSPRATKKAPSELSDEAIKVARDYNELDQRGKRMVQAVLNEGKRQANEQSAVEPVNGPAEPEKPKTRVIPLFHTPAAAGYVSPTEGQDYDDYEIPYDLPGDFAVRIDGDSMEPYIHDGEIVRCVRSNGLQIGEVGIFYVDGDTLCKQFCTDGQNLYLLSLNRDRADADRTIWGSSGARVQFYGKVLTRKKPPMP